MKRPAHGPGPNDGAVGHGLFDNSRGSLFHAQAQRPERARIILGLDRPKVGYYLPRLLETGSGYPLLKQPVMAYIKFCHQSLSAKYSKMA
jgi:hypothetical protein